MAAAAKTPSSTSLRRSAAAEGAAGRTSGHITAR